MGSHRELNPRPPTLAVDALTAELRLPCSNPALSLELEEQAKLTNDDAMYDMGMSTAPLD